MSQNNQQQGTLVNVKRVRQDEDAAGRKKVVLTFGLDNNGNNGLDALIDALTALRGRQVNFDIRIGQKEASNGTTFDTAFVIVKEMIPKSEGGGRAPGKFVPKNKAKAETLKARAKDLMASLEE